MDGIQYCTVQSDCEGQGYFWYSNSCHVDPKAEPQSQQNTTTTTSKSTSLGTTSTTTTTLVNTPSVITSIYPTNPETSTLVNINVNWSNVNNGDPTYFSNNFLGSFINTTNNIQDSWSNFTNITPSTSGNYQWIIYVTNSFSITGSTGLQPLTVNDPPAPSPPPSGGSSGGGGSSSKTTCIEQIQCTEFTDCINGRKIKTCSDVNDCGSQSYTEQITCSIPRIPIVIEQEPIQEITEFRETIDKQPFLKNFIVPLIVILSLILIAGSILYFRKHPKIPFKKLNQDELLLQNYLKQAIQQGYTKQQVKEVAQAQNQSQTKVMEKVQKMEQRGLLARFLFGPKSEDIETVKHSGDCPACAGTPPLSKVEPWVIPSLAESKNELRNI